MINNFNLEHWPIVYFNINNINLDDELFEEYKEFYLKLLIKCKKSKEKMLFICDLSTMNNSENIQMKYIIKQSEFNKEIYKFNKEYLNAVCIICKNKSIKTILNLYFSVSKPASPFKLCRSIEKANNYIKEKCNINFDVNIFKINNIDINDDDDNTSDKNEEIECNNDNKNDI